MRERALLITVNLSWKDRSDKWRPDEKQEELRALADTGGVVVAALKIVNIKSISPASYIGKGKIEEIASVCADDNIDVVIFNNDLTGTQQKNIEEIIKTKTVDRTQLILDIFARRARSNEGKIQVELAQLMYLLPRLTGKGIALSRLGGGIGTRGPGEQKLEIDRRRIANRIVKLKKDMADITTHRNTGRKQRSLFSLMNLALIGYTNAGKSTLLNALTGANVTTGNRLFQTLDPTIRKCKLANNQNIIISDTVGFLDRLPHHLIESFKATLEEVVHADLLIHVIDASHPKSREQRDAVYEVLDQLGAAGKPVINVLNKKDLVNEEAELVRLEKTFDGAVSVSAKNKDGLDKLLDRIMGHLDSVMRTIRVKVPQHNMKVVKMIHEHGHIIHKEYMGAMVYFEARIPSHLLRVIEKHADK